MHSGTSRLRRTVSSHSDRHHRGYRNEVPHGSLGAVARSTINTSRMPALLCRMKKLDLCNPSLGLAGVTGLRIQYPRRWENDLSDAMVCCHREQLDVFDQILRDIPNWVSIGAIWQTG